MNVILLLLVAVLGLSSSIAVSSVNGQQREASAEVRGKLFKQVLADYPEVRECLGRQEGGAKGAEEGTTVQEVDLNRDGVPEYQVELLGPCVCGMVNCTIYVYRQGPRGYELLLDEGVGYGMEILKTSTRGYADLRFEARATAATLSTTTFKFDGKQYRETSSALTNQETGETKPLKRRVQFKRGMSSTTISGKVTIALPDTFLLG